MSSRNPVSIVIREFWLNASQRKAATDFGYFRSHGRAERHRAEIFR